jgi:hypothetical protein
VGNGDTTLFKIKNGKGENSPFPFFIFVVVLQILQALKYAQA